MGKFFTLLIIFLINSICIYGQKHSIRPEVISAAGSRFQASSMIIDWTLGELSINTLQGSLNVVSQGFHQPGYLVTKIEEFLGFAGKINVFPNPVSDQIQIEMTFEKPLSVQVRLFDAGGKILCNDMYHGQHILESKSFKNFPGGSYFLNFITNGNKSVQTFKIQKIN
jgi:hypothetical protein